VLTWRGPDWGTGSIGIVVGSICNQHIHLSHLLAGQIRFVSQILLKSPLHGTLRLRRKNLSIGIVFGKRNHLPHLYHEDLNRDERGAAKCRKPDGFFFPSAGDRRSGSS